MDPNPYMHGREQAQMAMVGEDWLSDSERKAKARAIEKRKKAAIACAKKLEAAVKALGEYVDACNECRDASASRGQDDGRQVLRRDMNEFSSYLSRVYDK